ADSREPGLIPTLHQEPEEYSAMEREAAEMAPVESDFVASVPAARVPIAPAPPVSISDISTPGAVLHGATNEAQSGPIAEVSSSPLHRDEPIAPPAIQIQETHRGLEGPESDFEARVAAAMAAYSHVPEAPMSPASSIESVQHTEHSTAGYEPEI